MERIRGEIIRCLAVHWPQPVLRHVEEDDYDDDGDDDINLLYTSRLWQLTIVSQFKIYSLLKSLKQKF